MNHDQTIYFLKGLPASGKSTACADMILASGGKTKAVNMDAIRSMIDAGKWSREREKYARKLHNDIAERFVKDGYSLIMDNTNFAPTHLDFATKLADTYGCKLEVKTFDVPLMECIRRDATRGAKCVGEKVIYRMWKQYIEPNENPTNPLKKKAIIVDVDGTLTTGPKNRSPYDWDKVGQDEVNEPIADIVYKFGDSHQILIFTGRDGSCKDRTECWLSENGIHYDYIDIRPEGNTESDSIVKKRMFDKIKDEYHVTMVIDDREAVCGMWRELGLTCLQVDPGMF